VAVALVGISGLDEEKGRSSDSIFALSWEFPFALKYFYLIKSSFCFCQFVIQWQES